jgi:hypothetical protein
MVLLLHPRGKAPDTPVPQVRVGNAAPVTWVFDDACDLLEQPASTAATTTGTNPTLTGLRRSHDTPSTTPEPGQTLAGRGQGMAARAAFHVF